MEFTRNQKLLMDLKNSTFLPMFNSELFDQTTAESKKSFRDLQASNNLKKQQPELETQIGKYMGLKLTQILRNKRVQLAYLNHRIDKVQSEFWHNGGHINKDLLKYLHPEEKIFAESYAQMIRDYEKEISSDYNLNLTKDLLPPSQIHIQVRVIKDIGQIMTMEGTMLDMKKGTQLYVKKSDVEQLIINGQLLQVD